MIREVVLPGGHNLSHIEYHPLSDDGIMLSNLCVCVCVCVCVQTHISLYNLYKVHGCVCFSENAGKTQNWQKRRTQLFPSIHFIGFPF